MSWRRDPYKDKPGGVPVEPKPEPPAPPPTPTPSGISDLPPALGYSRPDPAVAPPRDTIPAPPIPEPPHCNGVHGPGACQWCDALASMATALRHQEAAQRALDERLRRVEAALGCPGGSAR